MKCTTTLYRTGEKGAIKDALEQNLLRQPPFILFAKGTLCCRLWETEIVSILFRDQTQNNQHHHHKKKKQLPSVESDCYSMIID